MKSRRSGASVLLVVCVSVFSLGLITGCQKAANKNEDLIHGRNVVRANPNADKVIGDDQVRLAIMGRNVLGSKFSTQNLLAAQDPAAVQFLKQIAQGEEGLRQPPAADGRVSEHVLPRESDSLLVGVPVSLIGEKSIFGGVIVKVSDSKSDTLGRLKLMDLSPVHVKSALTGVGSSKTALTYYGCTENCTEFSKQNPIVNIPVLGADPAQETVVLDLASLGDELNLVEIIDPFGMYTQLKTKSSKTVGFDYSKATIVFDIETHMIPMEADPKDPAVAETVITTRWYLKLASGFNEAFIARSPTPGVGFFTTERSNETKISRFSFTELEGAPVKYYIKNVPTEYQASFSESFDAWNEEFKKILGRKLLSYEFVSKEDPRNALLVAGDIRYNIVEWDLDNAAPYGGLGPSIANQFTGQTLSANILVQGPSIVKMYKDWFKVSAEASALRAMGHNTEAEILIRDFYREVDAQQARRTSVSYEASLGKNLKFRPHSQLEALEDPLMQRNDFDQIPEGFTYETYMHGYFIDLVAHEMGHNLGLRHNFRGNLGSTADFEVGKTSRSIMEYLGRRFRYLDRLSVYDTMAITYGYTGKKPENLDWFCTDEDVVAPDEIQNSAECSRDDATQDPFSFFESRLNRSLSLLLSPGEKSAPVWTVKDMDRELNIAVNGLLYYATTKPENLSLLTNFTRAEGRPTDAAGIQAYALKSLATQVCDPGLEKAVAEKETDEAKTQAKNNLDALRARVKQLRDQIEPLKEVSLGCI